MTDASPELARLLDARRTRTKAHPTGHMRERIAVALRGSRPSFFNWQPSEAYVLYLMESDEIRKLHDEWADLFLMHLDAHDLEIVDRKHDD